MFFIGYKIKKEGKGIENVAVSNGTRSWVRLVKLVNKVTTYSSQSFKGEAPPILRRRSG